MKSKIFLSFVAIYCMSLFVIDNAVFAEEIVNLSTPTIVQEINNSSVFIESANIEKSANFNPIMELLGIALGITTDEKARLMEIIGGDIKKKGEALVNVFKGSRHDRYIDLFYASRVYRMPRIANRKELQAFKKKIQLDSVALSKQFGLSNEKTDRINIILQEYFLHMGHFINDIVFLQGYNEPNNKPEDQKRSLSGLQMLIKEAGENKQKMKEDLALILNKHQVKVLESWLGWRMP